MDRLGITFVKIQYSVDNGSSWGLIKDSVKNTEYMIGFICQIQSPINVELNCSVDGISSDVVIKIFP